MILIIILSLIDLQPTERSLVVTRIKNRQAGIFSTFLTINGNKLVVSVEV